MKFLVPRRRHVAHGQFAVDERLLQLEALPPLEGELSRLADPVGGLDLAKQPELLRLKASQQAAEKAATVRSFALIPTLSMQGSIEVQYPRALKLEWGPVYQRVQR